MGEAKNILMRLKIFSFSKFAYLGKKNWWLEWKPKIKILNDNCV